MKKINLIEDEKLGIERVMFNGEVRELNKYYVHYSDLIFNPLNTRVKDKVYSKYPDLKIDDKMVFGEEIQNVVFQSLKEDHGKKTNKRLIEKLESGQTEALIISNNGIIISGNNRFSMIKENIDSNSKIRENFTKIIVALIDEELSPKDIIEWEISTQKESDLKLDYEEMNLIIRIKELEDEGTSRKKISTLTSVDEKEIKRYIEMADYYQLFLTYAGVPKKLDLHRSIKVYSFIDGLYNQLNKRTTKSQEKKILQKIYFDAMIGSEIPVQKFRDLLSKTVGNATIEFEDRIKLLTYINNNLQEELNPTIESIKENKFDENSLKQRKDFKDKNFESFFNNMHEKVTTTINFKKAQKQSSAKAILNQIDKANKTYEHIAEIFPTTITYSYTEDDKGKILNSLKESKTIIEKTIELLEE